VIQPGSTSHQVVRYATGGRGSRPDGWRIGRLDAVRRADPLLVALGLLTLATGLVDAACYLGLGRVFTANMTGNVVLLPSAPPGPKACPCWDRRCR
jgi:hypothetical protein